MEKVIAGSILAVSLALGGCATAYPVGSLYTHLELPVNVTSNTGPPLKTGVATCRSFLALVALGDCSIDAARKDGGIAEVLYVDWDAKNILGIIGTYKLTVYGK
ncbi:MAG: TRL-like family protein [Nitrococcus sp.]|nr:TRL-like family protein [Nitrococcus sp.]